jgi:hypothetical protein
MYAAQRGLLQPVKIKTPRFVSGEAKAEKPWVKHSAGGVESLLTPEGLATDEGCLNRFYDVQTYFPQP